MPLLLKAHASVSACIALDCGAQPLPVVQFCQRTRPKAAVIWRPWRKLACSRQHLRQILIRDSLVTWTSGFCHQLLCFFEQSQPLTYHLHMTRWTTYEGGRRMYVPVCRIKVSVCLLTFVVLLYFFAMISAPRLPRLQHPNWREKSTSQKRKRATKQGINATDCSCCQQ